MLSKEQKVKIAARVFFQDEPGTYAGGFDQAVEELAQENRRALRQLGVAGMLWMQVMMASMATWPEFNLDLSSDLDRILRWVSLFLTTPIVFYCCGDFFKGALRDLRTRHLTMDVSVSLAIGGAYVAGIWSTVNQHGELYFDAVGMFALFLLAGRYLERRARERTAAATAQLVSLLPASCLRLDEQGQSQRILLSELQLGEHILVPPGALLPADGRILSGQSSIDESLLTGEYLPLPRQVGDQVTAGTLNVEGPLTVVVEALGNDTRLSAIVRLLERAQAEKPRLAQLADQVAQWFLLIVLATAAGVGLVWWQLDPDRAFWIVLALLVATCPCALSLATPTALTAATDFAALEKACAGRLGVTLLDTASGRRIGHRQDERFPMCSTFKSVLAATVLSQAERRPALLDTRVPVRDADLIARIEAALPGWHVGRTQRIGTGFYISNALELVRD